MLSAAKYQLDMRTPFRSILIRLPETTIERLDSLVYELGLPSRASLVRRCINHQLESSEKHERPMVRDGYDD
jgi:metal-responsive CopG/Arc/MetJ family transcriptional regulator